MNHKLFFIKYYNLNINNIINKYYPCPKILSACSPFLNFVGRSPRSFVPPSCHSVIGVCGVLHCAALYRFWILLQPQGKWKWGKGDREISDILCMAKGGLWEIFTAAIFFYHLPVKAHRVHAQVQMCVLNKWHWG